MEKYTLDPNNFEQQMAFDLVANTNTSLFVTGEAGTGKTFWVKCCQENINKNFLVVAPTGIAAVQAGGRTINSTFRFKPEILGPDTEFNFHPDLLNLMNHVDTIFIDEISMVRADIIDAIDRWLRIAFHSRQSFAGKQLVFVGDMNQLPPVIKEGADSEMLKDLYGEGTPFFFKANVFKRMNLPKIEFKKVYRQKDETFVRILNNIRAGKIVESELDVLNKHVKFGCANEEGHGVILTALNATAEKLNRERLAAIQAKEFCYEGTIEGEFNPKDSPAPQKLILKEGAQVIFCMNDRSPSKRYVNGTMAKIVKLNDDSITVQLDNGLSFEIDKAIWEIKKKMYNYDLKKMETEIIGRYSQYPIKLSYCISIHKSQGMTFDKMVLDLTRGVFTSGQIYVALSRCRSLDGLSITNPVMPYHIRHNPEITAFSASLNDMTMIEDEKRIGTEIAKHLKKQDYDQAALVCMKFMKEKIRINDLRNASLLAKRMFDIMLANNCLMGTCNEMELLKGTSTVCLFLNTVISLYSGHFEEAIAFAEMVLQRKSCLEAMFCKAQALFNLRRFEEADNINCEISSLFNKSNECYDKKFLLFFAIVNREVGDCNIDMGKALIKLCPEYTPAYMFVREDMLKAKKVLPGSEKEEMELIHIFNDPEVTNERVEEILVEAMDGDDFKKLKNAILRLQE